MTFPGALRDLAVELFLGGRWVDVSGDRRVSDPVVISRGRKNEAGVVQHSTCSLTLDDRSHDYSPDNPRGAYFGELGLNTPIRVGPTTARDSFARTLASGWGSADVGGAYSLVGSGGTVQNSDWSASGGVGRQSVPVTTGYRYSYLPAVSYRSADVAVTFALPFTDVTGGDVEPANILLRGEGNQYYMVRVVITPAEAVTVKLMHRAEGGATVDLSPVVTIPGVTHSSAQALTVRAGIEAQTLRAKVWVASGNEPYGWHVMAHASGIDQVGWIGLRSGVAAGNTNTLPIVFSYSDLVIRSPRFSGEISSITPRWDLSGNDEYVLVEAAGITRRLAQGAPPVHSTLYRGIVSLATPAVAYWPCEDGEGATSIGSAISGGASMYVAGTTDFAAYNGFPSSAALPIPGGSVWVGAVPDYTPTSELQLRYLLHLPSSGIAGDVVLSQLITTGTAHHWEIKVSLAGDLKLQAWTSSDALLLDTGFFAFAINGKNILVSLQLEQIDGFPTSISWVLATSEVGGDTQSISGILVNPTLGRATQVVISPFGFMDDTAVGHINVRAEITSIFDLSHELNAYAEETALARVLRLCDQNAVASSYISAAAIESAAMGTQRVATLLTLLNECATADLGTLHEPRGELGLVYRERAALYNQSPAMTLDYGGGQVAAPFEPTRDDEAPRNDVTANRQGGASARAVLETGRMSVLEPSQGGVGRYDTDVTVNVFDDGQLLDIAGWLMHLGTVAETRYPIVRVNLANPQVVADAALSRAVLDLDIDDRFVIVNPKAGQTPDTITQLARGYTERINLYEHTISINAAPESPFQVLETDDDDSRLDGDGSTLSSGITSSATSFSVATPAGPLWSTDAADMPIPFTIGGETVLVGAIAGTSSPQTFSVARSVNGVVKPHNAGAAVALTRRATLPL